MRGVVYNGMTRTRQVRPSCMGLLSNLLRVLVALIALAASNSVFANGTNRVLTNVCDILSLSAKQAKKHEPVFVHGIVTAAESQWNGQFFVQDSTGGIFVANHSDLQPSPGDLVEISGVSHPGAFAPIINNPKWKKLGTAPLPEARTVPIEQVMSGGEDSQRVEISGIVRAAQMSGTESNLDLAIASAGYRFHAFPKILPEWIRNGLVGATVRLRGTAAAFFNQVQRRLTSLICSCRSPADFVVESRSPSIPLPNPCWLSIISRNIGRTSRPGQRVHVKGRITYQRPGEELFLQDESGGLRVKSRQQWTPWLWATWLRWSALRISKISCPCCRTRFCGRHPSRQHGPDAQGRDDAGGAGRLVPRGLGHFARQVAGCVSSGGTADRPAGKCGLERS